MAVVQSFICRVTYVLFVIVTPKSLTLYPLKATIARKRVSMGEAVAGWLSTRLTILVRGYLSICVVCSVYLVSFIFVCLVMRSTSCHVTRLDEDSSIEKQEAGQNSGKNHAILDKSANCW